MKSITGEYENVEVGWELAPCLLYIMRKIDDKSVKQSNNDSEKIKKKTMYSNDSEKITRGPGNTTCSPE